MRALPVMAVSLVFGAFACGGDAPECGGALELSVRIDPPALLADASLVRITIEADGQVRDHDFETSAFESMAGARLEIAFDATEPLLVHARAALVNGATDPVIGFVDGEVTVPPGTSGCTPLELTITTQAGDPDRDGLLAADDNCPDDFNPLQENRDTDQVGDACDTCPDLDAPQTDRDDDGIGDDCDNCPDQRNVSQHDEDADTVGDACDNCPIDANLDQANGDADGLGNACDDDATSKDTIVLFDAFDDPTMLASYTLEPPGDWTIVGDQLVLDTDVDGQSYAVRAADVMDERVVVHTSFEVTAANGFAPEHGAGPAGGYSFSGTTLVNGIDCRGLYVSGGNDDVALWSQPGNVFLEGLLSGPALELGPGPLRASLDIYGQVGGCAVEPHDLFGVDLGPGTLGSGAGVHANLSDARFDYLLIIKREPCGGVGEPPCAG